MITQLADIPIMDLDAVMTKINHLGQQLDLVNRLYGLSVPSEEAEEVQPEHLLVVPKELLIILLEMANWWIRDQLEHSSDAYRELLDDC